MKSIAVLTYYKVFRQIDIIEQKYIEQERNMHLYENKITTYSRQFPLEHIYDITFKKFHDEGGIVYLHTNHGVYSYPVKSSPDYFIQKYKKLRRQ